MKKIVNITLLLIGLVLTSCTETALDDLVEIAKSEKSYSTEHRGIYVDKFKTLGILGNEL